MPSTTSFEQGDIVAIAQRFNAGVSMIEECRVLTGTTESYRLCISEVIEAADEDALDLMRSRAVEREVLDSLDEPAPRICV